MPISRYEETHLGDVSEMETMTMKRIALSLACLVAVGAPSVAFADSVIGKVVAYDRKAQVIVLEDKTIWSLENFEGSVPEDLASGNKIEIDSDGEGEDGVGDITAIKIVK